MTISSLNGVKGISWKQSIFSQKPNVECHKCEILYGRLWTDILSLVQFTIYKFDFSPITRFEPKTKPQRSIDETMDGLMFEKNGNQIINLSIHSDLNKTKPALPTNNNNENPIGSITKIVEPLIAPNSYILSNVISNS